REPLQASTMTRASLPAIELLPNDRERRFERSRKARKAAALQFHHRCRELDDAGVEVHGRARWQMKRTPGAMHQGNVEKPSRVTEHVLRLDRCVIDNQCELDF